MAVMVIFQEDNKEVEESKGGWGEEVLKSVRDENFPFFAFRSSPSLRKLLDFII